MAVTSFELTQHMRGVCIAQKVEAYIDGILKGGEYEGKISYIHDPGVFSWRIEMPDDIVKATNTEYHQELFSQVEVLLRERFAHTKGWEKVEVKQRETGFFVNLTSTPLPDEDREFFKAHIPLG